MNRRHRWLLLLGVFIMLVVVLWRDRIGSDQQEARAQQGTPVPEALSGHVEEANGQPIRDASIMLADRTEVRTDSHGAFALRVPRGAHRLWVNAAGYAGMIEDANAPGSITITLLREARIDGRIVRGVGGKPVGDAFVLLSGTEIRWFKSDAFGSFLFDKLRPGSYQLTIRGRGWAAGPDHVYEIDAGQTRRIEIAAQPAVSLTADVRVEATAAPCTNAYVVLRSALDLAEGRGDAAGHVTIDGLLPGRYHVRVSCAGWGHVEAEDVIMSDRDLSGFVWSIPRGHRVRGEVIGADGSPAAGRMVMYTALGRSGVAGTSTMTDASGHFDLRGLPDGWNQVRAAFGEPDTSTVVRIASADRNGLLLRTQTAPAELATIDTRFVNSEGRPVEGVAVAVIAIWSGATPESQRFTTDSSGAGSAQLRARWINVDLDEHGGFSFLGRPRYSRMIRLDSSGSTRARFIVSKASFSIHGRVVDSERKPIPGAPVVAMAEVEGEAFGGIDEGWVPPIARTVTGAHGEFELGGLTSEAYRLRTNFGNGGIAVLGDVKAPADVDLMIEKPGTVSGRVVGRRPLTSRTVVFAKNPRLEHAKRALVESNGDFELDDLPSGHYVLDARGDGVGGTVELDLSAGEHLHGIELPIVRAARLSGRVVSSRGRRPLVDCYVSVNGEPSGPTSQTAADGAFTLGEVGVGSRILDIACGESDGDAYCADRLTVKLGDVDQHLTVVVPPATPSGGGRDLVGLGLHLAGTRIVSIQAGSAADRAGLRAGDDVASVDGFEVRGRPDILRCLLDVRSGQTIELRLGGDRKAKLVAP